ncbi:MAG: ATP-binding protein [Ruthenibacterium sp.]
MEKRINRNLCFLSVAAALLCSVLIFCVMQLNAAAQMKQTVHESAQILAEVFNSAQVQPDTLALKAKSTQRVTWLAADGAVLYDTAGATGNHADRPEIRAALKNGFGDSTRLSDTLRRETYYYAVRLANGSVLRVSSTTDSTFSRMVSCVPFVLMTLALVAVLATFASAALTKKIMAPIESIDVEHPLKNEAYEEFVPLLRRIDRQNTQLSEQLDAVRAMRDDLSDIMETMSEGLVVLSGSGTVLSANTSALALFGQARGDVLGQPLLALHRDAEFVALANAAEQAQSLQRQLRLGGRVYRAALSQAVRGGSILMLVDETEKCEAEQLRREFSANVSHELKTPLQSILGYAELLKNGIAKDADKPAFYDNIYRECRRLIALVQDIIDLSRLDEGAQGLTKLPKTRVDLSALARQSAAALADKAAEKQVSLTVTGDAAEVDGVPGLLGELLFNLMDNAVSYNRPGGSVSVETQWGAHSVSVTVRDTGLGIPEEHQSRVFERFYRVDKSHSRTTGGTGLGLSIVKHVAALHGAELELQSKEGAGTIVTVTFPICRNYSNSGPDCE